MKPRAPRIIDELGAALHPLSEPPQPPAWNHARVTELTGEMHRRSAAVLIAVRDLPEPSVVFTLRCAALTQHAGQVSFPGGRAEPDDRSALATALRESHEEIALDRTEVTPLGYLDMLDTVSDFCVTPVVARLAPEARLVAAPEEVDRIFEVPLAFLLDPANLRVREIKFRGQWRQTYEYVKVSPRIWGVTADMLVNLLQRMGRFDAQRDRLRMARAC
ncbi:MAG TPA: CoA pyrophosphatase [Nevskiaceae bacterium]